MVPLTLALFYRPPSSPYCVLDNLLTVLCTYIDPPSLANFILLGDFNINFFDTTHPLFTKLCRVTTSLSLTQVVDAPTHFSSNNSSLIDFVFLSSPSNLISCETISPLSNSDHLGLSLAVSAVKTKCNPQKKWTKGVEIWLCQLWACSGNACCNRLELSLSINRCEWLLVNMACKIHASYGSLHPTISLKGQKESTLAY